MSSAVDEGEDALLDRMEHIAEEEEDDMEDQSIDDDSICPVLVFGPDDDVSTASYGAGDYDHAIENPRDYQWAPTSMSAEEVSENTSYNSQDYNMSGLSMDEPHSSSFFDSEEDSQYRRGSFRAQRRRSSSRMSVNSAPSTTSTASDPPHYYATKRRVTRPGPETDERGPPPPTRNLMMNRSASRRRQSVSLKSVTAGTSSIEDDESSAASSSIMKRGFGRKQARRTSHSITGRRVENGSVVFDSVDTAISSLGQSSNSEWENVAAAAAVVAAGTGAGSNKRSHLQFAVDDKVLVFLNILNHTNSVDPQEAFTVTPVNRFGFPPGEGKSVDDQQGPYVYVLATVRKVHFDEDVRYYTVARADTGAEQRADTAWMEQCITADSLDSAFRAARQTRWSIPDDTKKIKEDKGLEWLSATLSWPVRFTKTRLIPSYKKTRATLKYHVSNLLYGDAPYACELRMTGINFLVLCSFIYMFLEVAALAFFPAHADNTLAIVGAFVWSVLALELFTEWIIRPKDYVELTASDRAYAPSTARCINGFHLFFEILALAMFIPEFVCLNQGDCSARTPWSGIDVSLSAVLGPTKWDSVLGRLFFGFRTLRIFGLVRHWKKMWINHTFRDNRSHKGAFRNLFLVNSNAEPYNKLHNRFSRKRKAKIADEYQADEESLERASLANKDNEEDHRLKQAATIGTALMVVNSHRALFTLFIIGCVMPILSSISGVNNSAKEFVGLLQATSVLVLDNNASSCEFLEESFKSWLGVAAKVLSPTTADSYFGSQAYILWAQVLPKRCAFQRDDGVITMCSNATAAVFSACKVWDKGPTNASDATSYYFAESLNVRVGGITEYTESMTSSWVDSSNEDNEMTNATFSVRVLINQNSSVEFANFASFILLFLLLVLSLTGLTVLRGDAGRLVLNPLQRMLKIVVRYAQNPLSSTAARKTKRRKTKNDGGGDGSESDADKDGDKEQLGNYETEQLINAISKIADLLRKCWGVAGAGIISSNLARTQDGKTVVFNPTVPGKRVYALFGFVAINGFSDQLRALDRDVMILINDVAKVVHDEVFRWALGDSGQCNKNLGAAFLMVFRIGDFNEVHEKKARATDVVFSVAKERRSAKKNTLRRRNRGINHGRGQSTRSGSKGHRAARHVDPADDTLQLASLPGIQAFSDRALLGMLKSFAGIHRDRNLQNWRKDFRLGAGVGAYTVNIVVGMDAGWAVEGAVGSEYKIDATYLSPHVNMASRMMSAAKQYGVTILLSQAVEELLSPPARTKLRHLDTVFVKGSSVAQRIFTYDARHEGVDFFLFERSGEQSDFDAEGYNPTVWDSDQDLRAMRQHVTEEFERKFKEGVKAYLHGDWKDAIQCLQEADDIMITTVLEEGYIDYNPDEIDGRIFDRRNTNEDIQRIRHDLGDGTCKVLVAYMEKRNGIAPPYWKGVRPLTSK